MVELDIFLYWKPCPDMGIENEKNFDPEILKEHGQALSQYLEKVSEQLSVLRENGWDYTGGLYDIMCYKDIGMDQAKEELKELDVDISLENLREMPEREWHSLILQFSLWKVGTVCLVFVHREVQGGIQTFCPRKEGGFLLK